MQLEDDAPDGVLTDLGVVHNGGVPVKEAIHEHGDGGGEAVLAALDDVVRTHV